MSLSARATWSVSVLLLAAGVAIRVNNAIRYRINWGFDATYNWRYIERLMRSWELPAPDADWATAHPPLFYYLCAALGRAFDDSELGLAIVLIRLISAALGLFGAALAVALVRRVDPANLRRALLAGGLLLFLPVHIYMSAMLNEEILVTMLVSVVVVGVAWDLGDERGAGRGMLRPAALGVIGGLALLTKLSGLLVVVAAAAAYTIDGWRRREFAGALRRAALLGAVALVVGGWYYARNWVRYGYLYPHGLATHRIMLTMPPGERHFQDYLRFPFAVWTDPQLLSPDLLRSVWGSTYVTVWFDGHRHFLPREDPTVTRAGTSILLLALLPTFAFAVGLTRGLGRALRSPRGPDTLLLLLVALTLSGYALFTWNNPWFAAVKGNFLLGLSVPFAFYTSEVLADWTRGRGARSVLIWISLAALVAMVAATFTFSRVFWNLDGMRRPGVEWEGDPRR